LKKLKHEAGIDRCPVGAVAGGDLLPWPLKIRSKRSQPAAAPTVIGVFLGLVGTTETCGSWLASDGGGPVDIFCTIFYQLTAIPAQTPKALAATSVLSYSQF
jgi:hypothetical protein